MLHEIARQLKDVKQQIKGKNEQLKTLKAQQAELEVELLEKMQEAEVDQIRFNGVGTISIRETIVPNVTDWEAFYEFITKNNAPYMLERRPSASAFRDYLDMHEATPPGVEPFTKKAISLSHKQ